MSYIHYYDDDEETEYESMFTHFGSLAMRDGDAIEVENKELFGRRKKNKSKIVSLFQSNKGILSDVAGVDYNKFCTQKDVFLEKLGSEFVDTIVLVVPVNSERFDADGNSPDVSDYNKRISGLFTRYGLPGVYTKVIGSSRYADYELIPERVYAAYKKTCPEFEKWQDGYLKFKLDTGRFSLSKIFDIVEDQNMWHAMAKDFVFLKELDVTQDFLGSMDRSTIEAHLIKKGLVKNVSAAIAIKLGAPGLILENGVHVGDNCITWLEFRGDLVLRKKLYLKVVQMLESASVRAEIGTNIPNLVANKTEEFQEKLVKAKDHGFTRLECTFYVNKIYKKQVYIDELDNMLALVNMPFFYITSFEAYWKALAERVISSMFIYIPDTRELAYCQWINSRTGKIQGMYAVDIDEDAMEWIRAAYSFNDRPIYYLQLRLNELMCVFEKQEIHFRDEKAITLIPGARKSLYPSQKTTVKHFDSFASMGLTEQYNISLDWPIKKQDARCARIAMTSFRGDFEFAVRNGREVEREIKNNATREFVEQIKSDIREKQRLDRERYTHLLQPISDSKFLYRQLLKNCTLIRPDQLELGVPYHMYGYYHNGAGHHYMMRNPNDECFYTCALTDSKLEAETDVFIKLVPSNKSTILYTCGKPFLYITPTRFKVDNNRNRKAVITIERVETNEEIRQNLIDFFTANSTTNNGNPIQTITHIKTANYKQDAIMLKTDEHYMVIAYGATEWRKVVRFFVIVKNVDSGAELKVKAGRNMEALIRAKVADSPTQFRFQVIGSHIHSDRTKDIALL